MPSNDMVGITVKQPTSFTDRTKVAQKCCSSLEMSMPLLVDAMNDRVGHAYSGMPDRLYVIDRAGKVVYKSGRGPFGFKPGEMEQSLAMLLLDEAGAAKKQPARVPTIENREAWLRLPPVEKGAGQRLPAWALALVPSLPRTTAAMLELDYLHRARSPLDPKLRAAMRWVAAHANRCAYTEAYAAADLRRAGVDDRAIRDLAGDHAQRPAAEKAALAFARQMALAAGKVTDEDMAQLIKLHGDKQVVAMVLLLAHASFQDRLVNTLGLAVEEGGPLPPTEICFARKPAQAAPTPRVPPERSSAPAAAQAEDEQWPALDFGQLQEAMARQKARQPRIAVPGWEVVRQYLPPTYPKDRPLRIRWSLVCLGYQPELATAWGACLRSFAEESRQDRVFEESLFWVITRTLQCYY
jgi:alkylhydroperoxidase family enzyme